MSTRKKVTVKAARSSREALDRLKGEALVLKRRKSGLPVRPMAVPGLERAMREVHRER